MIKRLLVEFFVICSFFAAFAGCTLLARSGLGNDILLGAVACGMFLCAWYVIHAIYDGFKNDTKDYS
jgi:hypothetical protein